MTKYLKQSAFTLVELLIVMVILGILAVTSFAFIHSGFNIYSQGVERQEAVAQARFMLTRLAKELRHAMPNSLRLHCENNCTLSQCLEFTPFQSATHYTGYLPATSPFTVTAVDFELNGLIQPSSGDWASIYPLTPSEVYDTSSNKRLQLTGFVSSASSEIDQWQFNQGFAQESPAKRIYFLATPVSFCIEGAQLYRYQDYGFNISQLDAFELQSTSGVKRDLLALHLGNDLTNNAFFRLTDTALTRNAVLNIHAVMAFNESEAMVFNHEVHIPNVP
ncbi:type II secretion system GspH family protein [Pseudoalteromonas shioyasakiensis]|uniref:PulJ/GspJ family protein n=1 Tax=Pseudoalteromonas shioyasakiensis TaxID=1190813 RepID=UPI0021177A9E|nr:type II secretion system protein [Pseudoalteromonas shioyasakiensis]MCQ8879153.1 type II secretion system GspH family protein [Pseudoalteromonas shioyasakiensis]